MTSEEKSWLLICRALTGEISAAEHQELENIFLIRPDLKTDYENLQRLQLKKTGFHAPDERKALEAGLKKFDRLINGDLPVRQEKDAVGYMPSAVRHTYFKWIAAASVVSMVAGLSVLYKLNVFKPVSKQDEFSTHFGSRIHKTLPDGSAIWLNSGSSIKYTSNFEGNGNREVLLNGEAFFDVKHDPGHPFIVHAGKLSVVVLGTAFDVKAYAADNFTETTLLRGKVEILMASRPGMNITLLPNQKITVKNENDEVKKTLIASLSKSQGDTLQSAAEKPFYNPGSPAIQIDETAWIDDRLVFKHQTFRELALQLERWYNIKIIFDNQKYQEKQFTGKFKDQDINEVMRALQLTQPFSYVINNKQIHIW